MSSRCWLCVKLFNSFQSSEGLFLNVSVLFSAMLLDEKYKGLKIFTVSVMSVFKETILCDFFSICRKRILWFGEKWLKTVCSMLRFFRGKKNFKRTVSWVTHLYGFKKMKKMEVIQLFSLLLYCCYYIHFC